MSESRSVVSDSLWPHSLYSPWNSLGQNSGVGSLFLLHGMFSTQGLNPDHLHCRQILYQLSHKRNPRILKWVAYPFSSGSSQPRDQTRVSCIAGRFFTNWAMPNAIAHVYIKVLAQTVTQEKYLLSPSSRSKSNRRFHYKSLVIPYRNNPDLSVTLGGWESFQNIVSGNVINIFLWYQSARYKPKCNS